MGSFQGSRPPACVMRPDIEGMKNTMETDVKDSHFFINSELGHHLPVMQLVYFLEYTLVSCEESLVENCTTILEEHLVA